MKKQFLLVGLLAVSIITFAQPSPSQSIEDSVFGWFKVYHFKGATESKKMDNPCLQQSTTLDLRLPGQLDTGKLYS